MPPSPTALDPLARFRHLAMAAGNRQPIPLRATRFVVRILDGMALVTAERCFRNAEARPIEATLTFPVPIHAALVGLSARLCCTNGVTARLPLYPGRPIPRFL